MGSSGRRAVLVAGDVTVDWNLACEAGPAGPATHACRQWGGAALLGDLIAAVADELEHGASMPIAVHAPAHGDEAIAPGDRRFHHHYALWTRRDDQVDGRAFEAWRVERFLGGEREAVAATDADGRAADADARADLIVLHDAGLGFRDRPELWPRALREPGGEHPWILLRMGRQIAQGDLWKRQLRPFAARTIVVVHIDDLRTGAVQVARELSWERTAEDLMSELLYRTHLHELAECAHVVVSFTTAGALVYSGASGGEGPRGTLVFDPAVMERMFNERHRGGMIGGVSALTAGIARQLLLDPQRPDVTLGVRRGVAALRDLDLHGYAEEPHASGHIAFPTRRIVERLADDRNDFKQIDVPGPSRLRPVAPGPEDRRWTILEARHPDDLPALATRIVLEGPEAVLDDVPHGQFGNLITFDRDEIEGFQSIRTLIRQYADDPDASKPLSIAVFGPPGSGKSWSVQEIARSVLGKQVEPLTFNLSQFDAPGALIDAFHRVRDVALGGKLPLVFWDEFDTTKVTAGVSQSFGWLPHFLSPMEDGEFQDGQVTHPIGRAVFVFAGGVCADMSRFREKTRGERLRAVKAPDFLSRLDGYVDIFGPDPAGGDEARDRYYLIRRAVLVRSLLLRRAKGICRDGRPEIDPACCAHSC